MGLEALYFSTTVWYEHTKVLFHADKQRQANAELCERGLHEHMYLLGLSILCKCDLSKIFNPVSKQNFLVKFCNIPSHHTYWDWKVFLKR